MTTPDVATKSLTVTIPAATHAAMKEAAKKDMRPVCRQAALALITAFPAKGSRRP